MGLAASTGPLVTFLDGDDWWDRTFVEDLVRALAEHPVASIAMSSYARVPGEEWRAPLNATGLLAPDTAVSFSRVHITHS